MTDTAEVPDRNLVYWHGVRDMKSGIVSKIYKNVVTEKFYMDMFDKNNKQIVFSKEQPTEDSCYEHHHIVIDDYIANPKEYE